MSTRPWRGFVIVGVLLAGVYVVVPGSAQGLTYDAFGFACVGAIVVGVRRNAPPRRLPWLLFAGGLGLCIAGNAILTYYDMVFDTQPFPSVADAFYLSGYVVLVVGVAALVRDRARGADRAAMIDALIFAVGFGVLVWAFWMVQYAHDPTLSVSDEAVSLAYPLMDVVLVGSLARLILGPGQKAASFSLLGLSLVTLFGADIAFGLTVLAGTYHVGGPVDFTYLVSYVLWGAAALHPSMRAMSTPAPVRETTLTRTRLVLLAMASLLAPVVMAVQALWHDRVDVTVLASAAAVAFLLVVVRMWGLMRRLADTAATRALAIGRERSLRHAAAGLVGARERGKIFEVARDAMASVAGGGSGDKLIAWSRVGEDMIAVAGFDRWDRAEPNRRLALRSLGPQPRADLLAGAIVGALAFDDALAQALGVTPGAAPVAVPVLLDGTLTGMFTVHGDRSLGVEARESLVAIRDQAAVALEGAAFSEDLHHRRAERRFAALIEQSSDVLTIVDDAGTITYLTPSARRVLGYELSELIGTKLLDLVHPEDRVEAGAFVSLVHSHPAVIAPAEWRMRHRDGSGACSRTRAMTCARIPRSRRS